MIPSSPAGSAAKSPPNHVHVVLVTPWYGGSAGGVAVVTESLVHALCESNTRCSVLEVVGDGWRPRIRYGHWGEEIITLCVRDYPSAQGTPARLAAWYRGWVARRIIRRLAKSGGRCVASFHYSMPEYEQLVTYFKKSNVPAVATFHGSDLTVNMDDPRIFEATQTVVSTAHVVTAVSRALRETLLSVFPALRDRSVVVHNSVPPQFAEHVRQLDQAQIEDEERQPRDIDVLFVGNLIDRKGVDILLRAWRSVHTTVPNAHLVIAGDGDAAVALRALATEFHMNGSVSFLGRQPRAALPALYRRAKLLVVPSRAEPLGVVVLEGQLCGTAVIASDVGGLPEIIEDGVTGVLVPPEDPQALAQAMMHVLTEDSFRSAIAHAGRVRVLNEFTPEQIAAQYMRHYTGALAKAPVYYRQ